MNLCIFDVHVFESAFNHPKSDRAGFKMTATATHADDEGGVLRGVIAPIST